MVYLFDGLDTTLPAAVARMHEADVTVKRL